MHIDNLEALERLMPLAKIRHWAQPRPWDAVRTKNKTDIAPNQVQMDLEGNIIRMPKLLGKPCFAQLSAFARHVPIQKMRDANGGMFPTRCGRCMVREACERVCIFRLRAHPELQKAHSAFMGHGGALGLSELKQSPHAKVYFDRLVNALVRHKGFKSVNDKEVLAYYDSERVSRRDREAKQKRDRRRAAIRMGQFDAEFDALLDRQRKHRVIVLSDAMSDLSMRPVLPPNVRRIPTASIQTTSDAWLARTVLTMGRDVVNPSSVAGEMRRRDPARYPNHNTLRQRVPSDLARVDALERLILPGSSKPLWERFNATEAMAEWENITHYNEAEG